MVAVAGFVATTGSFRELRFAGSPDVAEIPRQTTAGARR
jgi:hypothetical protein